MNYDNDNIAIRKAYWICQGIGWTLFFLSGVSMTTIMNNEFEFQKVVNHAVAATILFLISHYARFWFKRANIFNKKLNYIIWVLIAFVFIATSVGVILIISVIVLIEQPTSWPTWSAAYMNYINVGITYAIWISLYAGFKIFVNYRKNEVEKWRLEAKLLETEILALKAQINPHFVFNALNNIRSLISECPEKARKAVTKLSKLLRISLRFEKELVIPLEEEVEIVKEYLHLESLHLEGRLQVFWNLSPLNNTYQIPALGIQTLVENAIKHGISVNPDGGTLKIATREDDNNLYISVFNTGQLMKKSEKSNGTGLKNLKKRLKLFDGKSQFHIEQCSNNMVKAEIEIYSNENNNS